MVVVQLRVLTGAGASASFSTGPLQPAAPLANSTTSVVLAGEGVDGISGTADDAILGVSGIGTSTVVVHGVEPGDLHATDHRVVPDRIQAATYLAAVGVCGGDVVVQGARSDHMEMLLCHFRAMGLLVTDRIDGVGICSDGRRRGVGAPRHT